MLSFLKPKPLAHQAARALARRLTALGMPASASGNQIRLAASSTIQITIREAPIPDPQQQGQMVHFSIMFAYNHERQDSFVPTCATGLGPTLRSAVDDAVEAWVRASASPLLSVARCSSFLEAEWFPNGDDLGIPGWDCFSSPYVLRGPEQHVLAEAAQAAPLISQVRELLAVSLQPTPFHFVSLFVGVTAGLVNAECTIDGVVLEAAVPMLRAFPARHAQIRYATIRQSLVALQPSDGGAA